MSAICPALATCVHKAASVTWPLSHVFARPRGAIAKSRRLLSRLVSNSVLPPLLPQFMPGSGSSLLPLVHVEFRVLPQPARSQAASLEPEPLHHAPDALQLESLTSGGTLSASVSAAATALAQRSAQAY